MEIEIQHCLLDPCILSELGLVRVMLNEIVWPPLVDHEETEDQLHLYRLSLT